MSRPGTRARLEAVLAALEKAMSRQAACALAGVSRATFYRALERPAYADRVLGAEGKAEADLVSLVYGAARAGDAISARWLLERKYPETWRPRTEVALGGMDGGPLALIVAQASAMTPERQEAELRNLLDLAFPLGLPEAKDDGL